MKTNTIEDQHIWELEQSRRLQLLEAEQQAATETEKRQLKERHWMRCPKCGQGLTVEKHGSVEVDVCPSCRGVWLDATELETIVASERGFLLSCLRTLRRH
jgi:acetyl-CoA carboxylase beta subunit